MADGDVLARTKGDGTIGNLMLYMGKQHHKKRNGPKNLLRTPEPYGRSMRKNRLFERPQDASSGFSSALYNSNWGCSKTKRIATASNYALKLLVTGKKEVVVENGRKNPRGRP